MSDDQKPNPSDPRSLLNATGKRPPLYPGVSSLTRLSMFVEGYRHAFRCHSVKDESLDIPKDIHDWVAYRLHFRESTSGYAKMILERAGEEAAALKKFFRLLDEYDRRVPRIVARLKGFRRQYCRRVAGVYDRLLSEDANAFFTEDQ